MRLFFAFLFLVAASAARAQVDPAAVANPYKGVRVAEVHITGMDEESRSQLQRGLALAQRRGLLRRKPELYPRTLVEDVERARLWLARNGYPRATVTPRIEPHADDVTVILAVEPGPPSILQSVVVEGWPPGIEAPKTPTTLQLGRRFADGPATSWAQTLQGRLRQAGHAFATVEPHVTTAGDRVALVLRADPGQRFEVQELQVQGCGEDLVPLVRKTMEIERKDRFAPARLEEAELRLRQLDLFRQIKVGVERIQPGQVIVRADLIERPPRTIEAGAGYWTDELVRVHARWRHRNLFRKGRGAEVRGAWSIHVREGSTSTWWPGLLGARTRLQLTGSVEKQVEDSYDLLSWEGALGVRYRPTLATTWLTSLNFGTVDVTVKTLLRDAFDETGGTLLFWTLSWLRETADDRLDPTRGTVLAAQSEVTLPGAPSDAHFVSVETSATKYHALAEGWISASRVLLGWARPLEDSPDLLPNKRFYAGGSTSMRGFARRRLGPVDAGGAPLGGEAKVELSTELRFPLRGRLRAAVFVDTAQVWLRRDAIDLGELEFAAGPALMFATPLGPVRTDVAFRLTDVDPTAPDVQFHLTIGHPY